MSEGPTGVRQLRLGRAEEVPEGGARGYDPSGEGQDTLFAVRSQGVLHLWRDHCPHAGTPMAWRRHAYMNAAGDRIVCAAHGALFEPDTGLCVSGPCVGEHLLPVPFRIDAGVIVAAAQPGMREAPANPLNSNSSKETSS